MNMRCAIIGANGFLGKNLAFYLQEYYGIKAACYDIQAESKHENYYRIDLTDKESIKNLCTDVDYIFMFAGMSGTHASFSAYEKFLYVNELGLLNLLDVIKDLPNRPKIVFPSTRLVYKGSEKALNENSEKQCKTIYATNKLACEGYLSAYQSRYDIPFTIFRICVPYGKLLPSDYSYGTIGFMTTQAKENQQIKLFGGGTKENIYSYKRLVSTSC